MKNKILLLTFFFLLINTGLVLASSKKETDYYMLVYHMDPIDILTYGRLRENMVKQYKITKVKKITRKRKIKRFIESVESFDIKQTSRLKKSGHDLRVVVEVYKDGKCVFSCGFTGNGMLQYNNKCYLRDENSVRLLESYVHDLKFLDFNLKLIDLSSIIQNN